MLKDLYLRCPAAIKERFVLRRYTAGEIILHAGEKLECVYLIVSGKAEVFGTGSRAEQLTIGSYGEWEILGELEFFSHEPAQSSVRAQTPCELWQIANDVFMQWISVDNALCIQLLTILSTRFVSLSRFARVGVTGMLDQRIAYLLLTHADDKGVLPFSKAMLAQRAGTSQRSLNRVLKKLSAMGVVDCTTTLVKVLDKNTLTRIYTNQ